MRIKPNRLSQISVNFADISPRWNENFAYEHAQASHPGFALKNVIRKKPVHLLLINLAMKTIS